MAAEQLQLPDGCFVMADRDDPEDAWKYASVERGEMLRGLDVQEALKIVSRAEQGRAHASRQGSGPTATEPDESGLQAMRRRAHHLESQLASAARPGPTQRGTTPKPTTANRDQADPQDVAEMKRLMGVDDEPEEAESADRSTGADPKDIAEMKRLMGV